MRKRSICFKGSFQGEAGGSYPQEKLLHGIRGGNLKNTVHTGMVLKGGVGQGRVDGPPILG